MRAVWKFPLEIVDGPQTWEIPGPGRIVHVAAQDDVPTLWADVETDAHSKTRTFVVYGTGHPIDPGMRYVGTAHTHGGRFVWHIYEEQGP